MRKHAATPLPVRCTVLAFLAAAAAASLVWKEAKIFPSDGAKYDRFGVKVSISENGHAAIVGATGKSDLGEESGSAYVFARDGSGWSQSAKLLASDGEQFDSFGRATSLNDDGTVALISSPDDNPTGFEYGSVYVFTRDAAGWSQSAKIPVTDCAPVYSFGSAVSLSSNGRVALIGAHGGGVGNFRCACVFSFNGTAWVRSAQLIPAGSAGFDYFGNSASISGNGMVALVGAPNHAGAGTDSGTAYVFAYNGTGWSQTAQLVASDSASGKEFGRSVTLTYDGSTALVSSNDSTGSAYVFTRRGTGWLQTAKLVASDPSDAYWHVSALSGDGTTVLVSTTRHSGDGSALLFQHNGAAWLQTAKFAPTDRSKPSFFGAGLALSRDGQTVLLGAPAEEKNGVITGAAYIMAHVESRDGNNAAAIVGAVIGSAVGVGLCFVLVRWRRRGRGAAHSSWTHRLRGIAGFRRSGGDRETGGVSERAREFAELRALDARE